MWTFFLEDLGKKAVGIDNNKTMLLIAEEYKKLKNKKSKFFYSDLRRYAYNKFDSAIMMNNVIRVLSENDLIAVLNKLKDKVKNLIIELDKKKLKSGTFKYRFNNFDIIEVIKKKNKKVYERYFFNKQTGASFKILSYSYGLKRMLGAYGCISIKKTKDSYFYLLEFKP